jgi:transcriptional regulator with XRE-family HTH domain
MEIAKEPKGTHIGRKIEKVRKLRGFTQDQLGNKLGGISKQSVSKLESSQQLDDEKLGEICEVLGVTVEGLKNFEEETVLYNTANFYEGSHSVNTNISTVINNPIDKIIELYENLLKSEKEKVELLERLNSFKK